MSSTKSTSVRVCPSCAARNAPVAQHCWLCHERFNGERPSVVPPPTVYERNAVFQFSFASLLVTIALFAVLVAIFRLAPGLGILLAIIIAPAWIRTCLTVMRRQSLQPQTLAWGEKSAIFAVSVAIIVGIGATIVAAIVGAFASFCGVVALGAGGADGGGIAVIALIVALVSFGVVASLVTVFIFAWKTSRARRR